MLRKLGWSRSKKGEAQSKMPLGLTGRGLVERSRVDRYRLLREANSPPIESMANEVGAGVIEILSRSKSTTKGVLSPSGRSTDT